MVFGLRLLSVFQKLIRKINGDLCACTGTVTEGKPDVRENMAHTGDDIRDSDMRSIAAGRIGRRGDLRKHLLGKAAAGIPDTDL